MKPIGHLYNVESIIKVLENEKDILFAYFFGSYAKGTQNEKSDIDILLEFQPGTENIYEKKAKLREFLRTYFHRNVDLCREKYIKPFIKDYLEKEVIYV